jgi:hypothetical protein
MFRTSELLAATLSCACLDTATQLLEQGETAIARQVVDEGIGMAMSIPRLSVRDDLLDLRAFIQLKERIGDNGAMTILGRLYYAELDPQGARRFPRTSTSH